MRKNSYVHVSMFLACFLGQKHVNINIGVFKRHEMSYEKGLAIVVCKDNGKSYREIATIVDRSSSASYVVCKNSSSQEL